VVLQGAGSIISQPLAFAAGTYTLSFDAAQRDGNSQDFEVLVDGSVVDTVTREIKEDANFPVPFDFFPLDFYV
jgi:hypothetical protein